MKKIFTILAWVLCIATPSLAQVVNVVLTEPGTLEENVPEERRYTMTGLNITGPINGKDILFLRDIMSVANTQTDTPKGKLRSLNLANARIVKSDDVYYEGVDGSNRPVYHTTRNDTIGSRMFLNCKDLASCTLPSTTVYLDSLCFCATSLTSMRLPSTVKAVGLGAFEWCQDMRTFTVNEGCESFGLLCFYYCDGLTRFTFPNSVKELGAGMFNYCDALTSVKLPDELDEIPMLCFENTHLLATVTMPKKLRVIGDRAFMYSTAVKTLALPDGLEEIGEYAFGGASSLVNCKIPASVTEIGSLAFTGNWDMNGIQVDEENPYYCTVNGHLFSKDTLVMYQYFNGYADTTYTVPPTVVEIAYEGCGYSYDLRHIILPESLLMMDYRAIDFCYNLKDITCLATTPPDCVDNAIDRAITSTATLYVPSGTVNDYRKANCWEEFYERIKEDTTTGINNPQAETLFDRNAEVARYDATGRRIAQPVEGLNIIKYKDGTSRKVYVR